MKGKVRIEPANFNITFGDSNKPMLEYFEKIMLKAFMSEYEHKSKSINSTFLFYDVKLKEIEPYGLILSGFIVQTTYIETKSDFSRVEGIIEKEMKIKTSPFSAFAIILKNHRMIYIKNQKESPSIYKFRDIAKVFMRKYIREFNRGKAKEDRLPYFSLFVEPIPSEKSIDKYFKEIEKVTKVNFKLEPLNGDNDFGGIFESFRDELSLTDSTSGNISMNSPKNHKKLKEIVKEAKDQVSFKLSTILKNGDRREFMNTDFSEKIEKILPEHTEDLHDNIEIALQEVSDYTHLVTTSKANLELYNEKASDIKKYLG